MTTVTSPRPDPSLSTVGRERRSEAERRLARKRRRAQRGIVASYLHELSARSTPAAAAA